MGYELRNDSVPFTSLVANPQAIRAVNVEDPKTIELRNSIMTKGLLQSLLVRSLVTPEGQQVFAIIAGNTRYHVLKQLNDMSIPGYENIPVRIVPEGMSDEEALTLSLTENIQRTNMTVKEIRNAIKMIMAQRPYASALYISGQINKPVEYVKKMLNITNITNAGIQSLIDGEKISLTNADWLSKLSSEAEQLEYLQDAQELNAADFAAKISAYLKDKNDAAKSGRDPNAVRTFTASPRMRRGDELRHEIEIGCPNVIGLVQRSGVTDAAAAVQMAFAWLMQLDAESVAQAKADFDAKEEARVAKKAADEAKRESDRVAKLAKDPEALKKQEEILAKAKAQLDSTVAAGAQ